MNNEFFEIIKITDLKEKEIESFYINPTLTESERITLIMKKGHLTQKLSLISNLRKYFTNKSCVEIFFNFIKDKFLDLEQELQINIIETLTKFFRSSFSLNEILDNISDNHVRQLLLLIVKFVVNDEKSQVNYLNRFNNFFSFVFRTTLFILIFSML